MMVDADMAALAAERPAQPHRPPLAAPARRHAVDAAPSAVGISPAETRRRGDARVKQASNLPKDKLIRSEFLKGTLVWG